MNRKWMLAFMMMVVIGLSFITASSLLTGCAGQLPSATTYYLTSTITNTPSPTRTPTPTNTP
ncbi:MAG TPA: hypothetical protein VK791_10030 [bacterium]|jgi:hypothetical protein|nr:hypothetical protein [bacterium]